MQFTFRRESIKTMKIYNTLTRKKQEFVPIDKTGEVRIYSCGPTVYNYAHIGNLRSYIFMDILRRTLEYDGYHLKHVMNNTDVGHLVSDADEGNDKVEKAARQLKKDPMEITKVYTEAFFKDIEALNIEKPEIIAKATEHIPEMLEYVKKIVANGYAYETSKGIYFDISKLKQYGLLSDNKKEGQKAGARIEVDEEKKNPLDFAIWIKAPENHIMKWESPWGLSYPGWHLECSAMSNKYLGEVFDIHTGGVDHIPIHHENEIAQSIGANGKIPANYWVHGEFMLVDGGKMSKSLGNTYTLAQLEEKGYEPLAFRYFCLNTHYRNKLNFTFEGLTASQVALNRLREGIKAHKEGNEKIDQKEIESYKEEFKQAVNDDLNTPKALSILWNAIRNEKKSKDLLPLIEDFDKILALDLLTEKKENLVISEEVKDLLAKRKEARQNKDWKLSDELRDKIAELGYQVIDTKEGTTVEKIK